MVLAFDLGLRRTGWCGNEDHGVIVSPNRLSASPMTNLKREARLEWWADVLYHTMFALEPDEVTVEAPFMHPKNVSGAIDLIMLHGVLRAAAARLNVPIHAVENKTLKKWATGRGNAPKPDMIARACELTGDTITDDNEADATVLWHYWQANGVYLS